MMKGGFWRLGAVKRGLTGGLGRFSGAVDEGWDLDSLGTRTWTMGHPGQFVGSNGFFPFKTSALPLKFLDCG